MISPDTDWIYKTANQRGFLTMAQSIYLGKLANRKGYRLFMKTQRTINKIVLELIEASSK